MYFYAYSCLWSQTNTLDNYYIRKTESAEEVKIS